jgi:hypothetical protein
VTRAADFQQVAPDAAAAYRRRVSIRRLVSLLLVLALVLGPAAMLGGSPAMAMGGNAAAAGGHHEMAKAATPCHEAGSQEDEQGPDSRQVPDSCCVMMCAAIPAVGGELPLQLLPPTARRRLPRALGPHGLEPEADPPPPRSS